MALEDSFDDRNRPLYDQLIKAGIEINFEINPDANSWYVRTQRRFAIGAPDITPHCAGMAHELLHIKLYATGFSSDLDVYKYYNEKNSICTIEFISDLNNSLAHFMMLDEFLQMGYNIDDFLKDTPKETLLDGLLVNVAFFVVLHKADKKGDAKNMARQIVHYCAAAKFFELYKIKDPATTNGLHPDLILNPLRELNSGFVDRIAELFQEWYEARPSVDNNQFYFRLNDVMKEFKIFDEEN